jgi:hypothetical protein
MSWNSSAIASVTGYTVLDPSTATAPLSPALEAVSLLLPPQAVTVNKIAVAKTRLVLTRMIVLLTGKVIEN